MPKSPGVLSRDRASSVRVADSVASVSRFLARDPLSTLLLVGALALLFTFFALLGSLGSEGSGRKVALSTVTRLAAAQQLREATLLDYDHQVVVITTTGAELYANYPSSDAATLQTYQGLLKGRARVEIDPQSGKSARVIVVQFLIPILILVFLFAFFMRQSSAGAGRIGAFSAFRGRGRRRRRGETAAITFASVAGAEEAVDELREIRDYLAAPERYRQIGASAPKGVLLVGVPGTGKTLLARAIAGEADAAFFSASGSEFVESLVGVGAARIRDMFARARRMAPAIVFIDELDAAGRKRGAGVGQGNDEREQTLNQLLVEMDGFAGDAGIVVIGATNRPDILDPALLRPGRFDRQVVVNVPDVAGRAAILELHARGRRLAEEVDLDEIARLCPGFTGADLANLINEAALLSVREGFAEIDQVALEEAIDRIVAGPAMRSHVLTDTERRRIAIHEAGHAVATRATDRTPGTPKLSIVVRGRQLGIAAHMLTERDALMHTQPDLERHLIAVLAGTTSELIEFGWQSTGASDDLHSASKLARQMVTSYGMSPRLGLVTVGEAGGEVFLGATLQDLGSTGPHTLDVIDEETERIVEQARARAELVLRANWSTVQAIAAALLEHETLSGAPLEELLAPVNALAIDEIAAQDDQSPA